MKANHLRVRLLEMRAEFCGEHCAIRLNGVPIPFPAARYEALVVLVDAKLGSVSGRAELVESHDTRSKNLAFQTIRRARMDIDAVWGIGIGELLIASCGGGAYRLTLDREQVSVDPSVLELVGCPHFLYQGL